MKWIKGKDRVPENGISVVFRLNKSKPYHFGKLHSIQSYLKGGWDELEWLDEQSPSFSIEDMEDSYFEGKNGDCSFENFMKQEHNIDITK